MDNLKNFVQKVRTSASGAGTSAKMDNAAYKETEPPPKSKDVNIPLQHRDASPQAGSSQADKNSNSGTKICKPEVCRRARQRYTQAQGSESPWHRQKTYTLIGALVLFIIWIIVYATCSSLGLV